MSFLFFINPESIRNIYLRFIPPNIARKLVESQASKRHKLSKPILMKQLLVDISVIVQHDARTGVQRLVRGILVNLIKNPPQGYNVLPVYSSRKHGYEYAPDFIQNDNAPSIKKGPVIVNAGDVFLGLDLAAHLLSLHQEQLVHWKLKGVSIYILVYDLLPLSNPEWFNTKTSRNFRRWIKTLAVVADGAVSISQSTQRELVNYLNEKYKIVSQDIIMNTILLGTDIESTIPSQGLPENAYLLTQEFRKRKTFLMVGTIEPRKGHQQVLLAFEHIWQQNHDVNLIFVGKSGWKTEKIQRKMRIHSEKGRRFWWFENASDEWLEQLYLCADGVIVASEGEGYGLPLVEAAGYNKPVLARDIPVFREIADRNVSFFQGKSSESLAVSVTSWMNNIVSGDVEPCQRSAVCWSEVTVSLAKCLNLHVG